MHYIDLLLSFILFIMGILAVILKRFKKNIWIVILSLLFFPIAIATYYFPETDKVVFGSVSVLQIIVYPLVKILIILVLFHYIFQAKREARK